MRRAAYGGQAPHWLASLSLLFRFGRLSIRRHKLGRLQFPVRGRYPVWVGAGWAFLSVPILKTPRAERPEKTIPLAERPQTGECMSKRNPSVRTGVYENEAVVFVGLTQGRVAIVDADEWPSIAETYGTRWRTLSNGHGGTYAARDVAHEDGGYKTLTLARAVMSASDGSRVEVINGDSLDCRRSNLRRLKPKDAAVRRRKFAEQRRASGVAA